MHIIGMRKDQDRALAELFVDDAITDLWGTTIVAAEKVSAFPESFVLTPLWR